MGARLLREHKTTNLSPKAFSSPLPILLCLYGTRISYVIPNNSSSKLLSRRQALRLNQRHVKPVASTKPITTFHDISRSQYKCPQKKTTPHSWPSVSEVFAEPLPEFMPRQVDHPTTDVPACGYRNSNPSQIRTANSGYDYRVYTEYAIWGSCLTTVSAVSDCGLLGSCVDTRAYDLGCGILGDPSVMTCIWYVYEIVSLYP